jgi:hypothetical protein
MKRDKEYKVIIIVSLSLIWLYGLCYMISALQLDKQRKINEQLRIEYNELKKSYEELEEHINLS